LATVAELLVKIGGDGKGLQKELAAAQRQIKRTFGAEALGASDKLAAGLGVLSAAAGAAAVAAGKMAVSWNLAVNAIEDVTGMTGEAASRLLAVGQMVGLSGEDMSTALVRMSKSAEAAFESIKENGADSTDAFTKFGIAVQDSNGNMLSAEQIYANVAARHREMANGVEKTAMEMAIFGKKGAALNDLLNLTTDQMDDLTGRAEKMGLVVNSETSQAWESATFELNRAKLGFTAAGNAIISDLLPAVSSATTKVADFLEAFAVDTKMRGIRQALANLIPEELAPAIITVAGALTGAMVPALKRTALAIVAATVPLLPWMAALSALGLIGYSVYYAAKKASEGISGLEDLMDDETKAAWDSVKATDEAVSAMERFNKVHSEQGRGVGWGKDAQQQGALAAGAGAKGAAKAYDELAKAAKQTSKEIYKEWLQMTNTQTQQLDAWYKDELDKLNKSASANENYERDLTRLREIYAEKRRRIVAEEAERSTQIFRDARDRMTAMGNIKASIGLEGVQKEKFDLDTEFKAQITRIGDYYDDLTAKFAAGTQQQKDDFIKQWTDAGYQFKVNEQGMVDFTAQAEADKFNIRAAYQQKWQDYVETGRAFEAELDAARDKGKLDAFAALLNDQAAMEYQSLQGRQAYIDEFYTIWQDTHRSAMSYMAEAMGTFYNGATSALTDIFTGAKSASEAFQELGKSILKMLAQWVAQQIAGGLAMAIFGKSILQGQVAASTAAAAKVAAAWSGAAAAVSLASFGANSVPAMAGMTAAYGLSMSLAIPKLASGGITTGPTLAQIGERGTEAVLPLNRRAFEKAGLVGQGSVQVEQHNYGNFYTQVDLDEIQEDLGMMVQNATWGAT
jgi:hypothetical protein